LITGGYVPGNTLAAQHLNWYLNHLTMEINAVLTAGGVAQNSAVDTQLQSAILNQVLSLGGQGYLAKNSGSPFNLSLTTLYGTVDVTAGGSAYVVKLPDAATAYAVGYEVDIRKADAGAGYVTVQLQTAANYLANVLNGSWDVTEQYGHVRLRAIPVLGGYGYAIQSCDGTLYRNVLTSIQGQTTPNANQWYNKGGSLALSPGVYELSYKAAIQTNVGTVSAATGITLSTGSTSETDIDLTTNVYSQQGVSGIYGGEVYAKKKVIVASATTFYLNISSFATLGGTGNIEFICGAGYGNTIIEAKRVG
jgi:hypothetical protein